MSGSRIPTHQWAPPGGTTGQALVKASNLDYDLVYGDVSGGPGGDTVHDRKWILGPVDEPIDEFSDNAIAGAYTQVDGAAAPAANVEWTEGADVLSVYHKAADTGNAFHALLRPLADIGGDLETGDAIVTALTVFGTPTTNYQIAGLALTDGDTYGAGKQLLAEVYSEAGAGTSYTAALDQFTNFTTGGTSSVQSPRLGTFGVPIFVRVVYLGGTTWRMDRSGDGVSWRPGANITYASFTPTHVGVFCRDAGSGTPFFASFEFLRRVAGIT